MELHKKNCVPCDGIGSRMPPKEVRDWLYHTPGWLVEGEKIVKEAKFKDFAEAMKFVNRVADLAEHEGHHPDLHIHWNTVRIELWTHAVGGLSENDFVMAAKINKILG